MGSVSGSLRSRFVLYDALTIFAQINALMNDSKLKERLQVRRSVE